MPIRYTENTLKFKLYSKSLILEIWSAGKSLVIPPIPTKTVTVESTDLGAIVLGMYPINRSPRGFCIIINNVKFPYRYGDRFGSDTDAKKLQVLFKKLDFHVLRWDNLTRADMLKLLEEASSADHSDKSCFTLVVLSHGGKDGVRGVCDKPVSVEEIARPFTADNCSTLMDKPKIFFLVACRGRKYDPGVTRVGGGINTATRSTAVKEETDDSGDTIPVLADMLFSYPTPPGFLSYRQESGTWFVESFVKVMERDELAKSMDLVSILTEVNRDVAEKYESIDGARKMMPVFTSSLRYKLFLPPK